MKFPINIDLDSKAFDESKCSKENAKWFLEMNDSNGSTIMCFANYDDAFTYASEGVIEKNGVLYVTNKNGYECTVFRPETTTYIEINTIAKLKKYMSSFNKVTMFWDDRNPMDYILSNYIYFIKYANSITYWPYVHLDGFATSLCDFGVTQEEIDCDDCPEVKIIVYTTRSN